MSDLLDAVDTLLDAKRYLQCAAMAMEGRDKAGLTGEEETAAVATVLQRATDLLERGLDAVEQERLGRKARQE